MATAATSAPRRTAPRINMRAVRVSPVTGITFSDQKLQNSEALLVRGDRDLSLTFMHGYWLGTKGTTEFVANSLGKASDDFVEYCLDHPNDNAFQSMEKFLK